MTIVRVVIERLTFHGASRMNRETAEGKIAAEVQSQLRHSTPSEDLARARFDARSIVSTAITRALASRGEK